MPGFTIKGYIYVYYPHPESGLYVDELDQEDSSEEEELGENERELTMMVPHPDGVLKECYPVKDFEDIDICLMSLRNSLLLSS